jgi:translocator protein
MTLRTQILGLAASLGVVFIVATAGGAASIQAGSVYVDLMLPPWAPPPWLFGPVWTMLYILIAIAAWRVWKHDGWKGARGALMLYVAQLVLNALWTWIFFAWQMGTWALIEIVVLWLLIIYTMIAFARHDRLAAWLMAPYLVWVTFAAALTYALWQLNPLVLP